jgi:hypothetical protein
LPKLTDLRISLGNRDEAVSVLTHLPNILYLNGNSTGYENTNIDIDAKDIEAITLNAEIDNFNVYCNNIDNF